MYKFIPWKQNRIANNKVSLTISLRPYLLSLILLLSILLGGFTGYFFGGLAPYLKPFGEIFLNLIFTAIIPLIFFSITTAIAGASSMNKLGKITFYMILVFLLTGLIAAGCSLLIVKLFPPAQDVALTLAVSNSSTAYKVLEQISGIFTVSELSQLFSQQHIFALIIFSILVGLAVSQSGVKAKIFIDFLNAGEDIFMRVFGLIMYYAPIGFFAYFAVLVHDLGPQLMKEYLRIFVIYYVFGFIYFMVAYTIFAYMAGKTKGIKIFWRSVFMPCITAIATCSSAASIPANLKAAKKIGIAPEIYETVIPLGTMIHKDGSIIGGMFKIAFLFGIFHLNFSGVSVLAAALGVSLLVGTVMGAIPSGGMLGELLILNLYGFPPSVLIVIAAISIIIDPLATMLNVSCNTVSCMLVSRLMEKN